MKKSILVFGLGFLQKSLIEQCKSLGLYVVGMDITDDALLRDEVDAFEVVAGDDFEAHSPWQRNMLSAESCAQLPTSH
ncbi:hypothetical protein DW831_06755 [Bacteroides uniformis]|uniref:Uncharacterized protein n=1 Tax=Bacteroides uniformis TaxID=820 RepID=A0A414BJ20_BACUN|nr:hypothetical protein DW988_03770 [Bacteroides uniformis]RHC74849.1 hypothetical protein DW831_06755 [Bacteroides uniformis]